MNHPYLYDVGHYSTLDGLVSFVIPTIPYPGSLRPRDPWRRNTHSTQMIGVMSDTRGRGAGTSVVNVGWLSLKYEHGGEWVVLQTFLSPSERCVLENRLRVKRAKAVPLFLKNAPVAAVLRFVLMCLKMLATLPSLTPSLPSPSFSEKLFHFSAKLTIPNQGRSERFHKSLALLLLRIPPAT
jgi:hypothetical protein